MKILIVVEHYHPYIGGAEKLFRSLAESLVENGHQVTVLTTLYADYLSTDEMINGVHVKRIRCYNRFLFSFFAIPFVLKYGRGHDLIQTATYNAALPAWIGAKLLGKKSVLTFYEYWNKLWWQLPFLKHFHRIAYSNFEKLIFKLPFTHIVAISDFTKDELINGGKSEKKVSRIYCGMEKEWKNKEKRGPIQQKFRPLYLGRLGVSKGLDIIIPAFAEFNKKHPETELELVIPKYPTPLFRTIQDLIHQQPDPSIFKLYHELPYPELLKLIGQASCVCIPSYSEGFCFVAAEASGLGIPILSSGKGALQETVSGHHITLDSVEINDWTNGFEKAYNNQYEYCPPKYFSLEDSVRKYIELYRTILT